MTTVGLFLVDGYSVSRDTPPTLLQLPLCYTVVPASTVGTFHIQTYVMHI
jgi:hypothetical protein